MKRNPRPASRRRRQRTASQIAQFEQLERRNLLSALITVNSTLDSNARDAFLTLREAILVNNLTLAVGTLTAAEQAQVSGTPTSSDTDTIGFNIPGAGVQSITPTSNLPSITDPAIIDGYTQPGASANTLVVGSNAVPLIELVGGSGPGSGLVIAANNSTVRGLVIHSFGSAIYVQSGGNTIEGNWLGIDDDGNTRLANVYDVFVANSPAAANNLIGGTTPGSRNVMAGTANQNAGIMLFPGGGSATIQGNYIGMNAQGTDGIGASGRIYLGTPGNLVGGTAPGSGNVISGRAIEVYASGNTIQGNTFGLNASGSATLANNLNGIFIAGNSIPTDNNLIGGTTPEARNVFATSGTAIDVANSSGPNVGNKIQGNYFGTNKAGTAPAGVPSVSGTAIRLNGGMNNLVGGTTPGAGNVIANFANGYGIEVLGSNNTIQGNRIGTNAAGTAAIPNGAGIYINSYVSNTLIGGNSTAAANIISGNLGNGILIAPGGTFNTVQGNLIGVAADGISPLGNGTTGGVVNRNGIRVDGTDNLIGGSQPGEGNTIAFHGGSGVLLPLTNVLANQGLRNSVLGNAIHSNSGLGIDIYGGGVTLNDPNDVDAGPNDVQNFPVVGSALTFGSSTTIQGTLNSIANSTFRVEFFSSPTGDPTGFGEGQTFLGSTTVTTDGSGNGSFSFNTAVVVPVGHFIASTATGAAGQTSEFSGVRAVTPGNVAPSVNVGADTTINNFAAFARTGSFTDPDADSWTATVDYGDGSGVQPLTLNADKTFALNHAYANEGTYSITVAVNDGVAGTGTDTVIVTVNRFRVDTTADNSLTDGLLTLREAIANANFSADANTIRFDIPAADPGHVYYRNNGVAGSVSTANIVATTEASDSNIGDIDPDWMHSWWRVKPTGFLGNITRSVLIDGYTQAGASANTNGEHLASNAILRVELNGGLAGATAALGNDTHSAGLGSIGIRGLVIDDWQLEGIYISAVTGGHVIAGNFVGVDVSGSLDRGNGRSGVWLTSNSSVIGGTTPADRNIIAGNNLNAGVNVNSQSWTGNNRVQGNFIGLGRDGVTAIGNVGSGVVVGDINSSVGGTTAGARNVISANTFAGISVGGFGLDMLIQGNYIGTDVTGTLDRGNSVDGVFFTTFSGLSGGTIGGTSAGAGNLISGNQANGISLGNTAQFVTVQGNFIGTDRTGTQAIGNSQRGIRIGGNTNQEHLIGGTTPGAGNLISGNALGGIFIDGANQGANQILGNRIGTDVTGTLPLGNGFDGIVLENSTKDNTIGGTTAGAGNVIAFNARNGVALRDAATTGQSILGNSIYGNGALGIDLSDGSTIPNGVTPNDPGDADTNVANSGQNYPVLATAVLSGGITTINGTLNSNSNGTFRVEFFSSGTADPTGFGEGQTYLGFTIVSTDSNGDGAFSFNAAVAIPVGHFISCTATDALGNTSEFSGVRAVMPALSINDVSANEGVSGITAFTFTVTLSANPSSNVTVMVNTADGTTNPATTGDNDYSAISNLVLTFVPNGPLTQTVTVNVAGDGKFERDETFFVILSSPAGATLADGQGLGAIQNDDLAPTLAFSTTNSVLEGDVTADDRKVPFTVTLSAVSGVEVSGTISTSSGSATEGTDFASADGVAFVIPAGQTQATILVSVIEDTTFEADEQFTIDAAVSDPSTVSNNGGTATGTGTIENDDAMPTLSIDDISLTEGVSGITAFTFTVTLSANPSSNVTVTVNTADGTTNPATTADNDYSAITNLVLTFLPNGPLTQTVTVNVGGDSKFERDETFFVILSSPAGATLADGQGLGTIQNDDVAPTISFSTDNSVLEGDVTADDRKVPFTVTLSAVSGVDVSGTISTSSGSATEGTDFVSVDSVAFVIPAGQTQATILVSVIEDTTFEADEQFTIDAAVSDPSTVSNNGGTATGTGTIENDDAMPTLSIDDISLTEGVSGITAFTFTVTLSANPSSNVTVMVNTADGTTNPATTGDNDYSAITNLVLTFLPNGPLTQTVTVNVGGDSKFERDETFFVILSSPAGATLADGQGLGTIQNDDVAPTISFSTDNSVLEGDVTADDRKVPFTVTLSAVSGVDVSGTISTSSGSATEGTDFVSADGVTFTIPAGQTQATIFVSVIEDTTFEPDEQFTITATAADLTSVSNSGGTASGIGTIQNDDVLPTLVISNVSANEGVSGITAFTFTVTLSANPSSNVFVTVNTANGTTNPATTADNDYSAITNLVVTFVPNGPLTQTVTVNVAGDSKFERDETFFVNLSSPTGATLADGQGLGTIQNDDLAPTISFSTNNSVLEGNVTADDRKVPFTITLSAVSGVAVTGTISTTSGTATEGADFASADGVSFVIPAGQLQATILVSVIEDTTFEPDEQFTIDATVSDPSTVSNSGATATGTGTIENDDTVPTLSINDFSLNEGVSGITAFTFTVTLSANPSSNVTVTVNTANGTTNPATTADNDYAAISSLVLTFVPNGPLTRTVTVNVAGDSKFERNESFFVNLSSPTGAMLADGQGLGTIQNDDLAPTLSFSTTNSVLEGNVTADDRKVPFTITLSAVSGVDVTGTISTASGTATEGTDFTSADGVAFVIPAGQTQATILVSVIEDTTVEANETFTITATASDLTTVSNASGQTSGTGTIQNDDTAGTSPVVIGSGCCGPALIINGTSGNDIIRVVAQGTSAVNVLINGTSYGPFTLSSFQEVIVYGKNGNDDIELASTLTKRAFLFGEAGNDRLKGGNGANMLVGGSGCDNLIGSQGADVLIGGDGSDTLVGNGGDDLLIAGWSDYDTNFAALCSILSEWSRTDKSYNTRVNNLRFGGGLNGSVRLTDQTVHDDGDFDKLTGSAGCDWFFANWCGGVLDQITDRHSTERVDELD